MWRILIADSYFVTIMTTQILQYGDPFLHTQAHEITNLNSVRLYVPTMCETMYAANGIGLAAPQVGLPLRFFVYDHDRNGPQTLINPQVVDAKGSVVAEERCLSVPFGMLVERFAQVTIQGFDLHEHEVILECRGLLARLMQHELDHLNGVLIADKKGTRLE